MFFAFILSVTFVPLTAFSLCITLALRLKASGLIPTAAFVIGGGPVLTFVWTFLGAHLLARDNVSQGLFLGISLALYGAVLWALFECLSERLFKKHTLWAIVLTVPSIVSVVLWGSQ